MHYDFCTLTDKNFAYKCLALFNSIQDHMPNSTFWVLCLDTESEQLFKKLNISQIKILRIQDLHNSKLEQTRTARTKQEFAWTCKPALMNHLLEAEKIDVLVFADSDLLFYASLDDVLTNHPNSSILLTSHKFSQKKSHMIDVAGYFNSGFIIFRNDQTSQRATREWKDECIEWCFSYHKNPPGKKGHGDQTYLTRWPNDFPAVEEILEKGINLGTWNVERYNIERKDGSFLIDDEPLICFHFHGYISHLNKKNRIKPYPISVYHKDIYHTYTQALQNAQEEITKLDPNWKYGFATPLSLPRTVKQTISREIRQFSQAQTRRKERKG
jgi:hypothetical protein